LRAARAAALLHGKSRNVRGWHRGSAKKQITGSLRWMGHRAGFCDALDLRSITNQAKYGHLARHRSISMASRQMRHAGVCQRRCSRGINRGALCSRSYLALRILLNAHRRVVCGNSGVVAAWRFAARLARRAASRLCRARIFRARTAALPLLCRAAGAYRA
jgi:hypothetical protein